MWCLMHFLLLITKNEIYIVSLYFYISEVQYNPIQILGQKSSKSSPIRLPEMCNLIDYITHFIT